MNYQSFRYTQNLPTEKILKQEQEIMSEKIYGKTIFSLLEVAKSIQTTINDRYKTSFWVKAEMNKLNFYKESGHCYPELVEKMEGRVIAQMKSNIWKDDYLKINNNFQNILKEPLKDGIKILFLAKISFDPSHGLALRIIDIDPAYTLGDLEREKQETVNKLKDQGIFNKNKLLSLPLLPQRIAIISVDTSKGYADFIKVIDSNPWRYRFFHLLFPSLLQGDNAVDAIIHQLYRIKKVSSHFDVVAIIRGGGGDIGLSCYNSYSLAKEIALFPIPVITGIGHATNETVSEMISFSNAITPTKLAEYLLQNFHNFSIPVKEAEEKITDKSRRLIIDEKKRFQSEIKLFHSVTEKIISRKRNEVEGEIQTFVQQTRFRFKNEKQNINLLKDGMRRETISFLSSAKEPIKQFAYILKKDVGVHINANKLALHQQAQLVARAARSTLDAKNEKILHLKERLSDKSSFLIKSETAKVDSIEKNVNNMSPANVLRRGYSITLVNGKAIKDIQQVKEGNLLNTILFQGAINSIVESTSKQTNDE